MQIQVQILIQIPHQIIENIAVRLLCSDNYLTAWNKMRFLVVFKRVHPAVHREVGAGAGELAGGCCGETEWKHNPCTDCMDPASDPSET